MKAPSDKAIWIATGVITFCAGYSFIYWLGRRVGDIDISPSTLIEMVGLALRGLAATLCLILVPVMCCLPPGRVGREYALK